MNREPEQSSAQTNNATQQVVKTTFSTKETLDTIGNKTSDIDDFIPLIRTGMLTLNEGFFFRIFTINLNLIQYILIFLLFCIK